MSQLPLYLDCNASNPIDARVIEAMTSAMRELVGNAGSPHGHGARAKEAVQHARDIVGSVVGVRRHEVLFTSGATESNNLAILGLAAYGKRVGKKHLVASRIEHKAVLEPLQHLRDQGFEVTLVPPNPTGQVPVQRMVEALRSDTLLVSLMQVNNETGIRQPIEEVAAAAQARGVWMHVDAAQGFGRENGALMHPGITLISASGHKIYGPQGIGALIVRRERNELPPLDPLLFGGGQELGLRSGTLPVPLITGFAKACQLAMEEGLFRAQRCQAIRERLLTWFQERGGMIHGDRSLALPHVLNVSLPGWEADELIEAISPWVSISNGSACTSVCATASHVLSAMGIGGEGLDSAVRWSWSHETETGALEVALAGVSEVLRHGRI
jgi:cysteine desulfurase